MHNCFSLIKVECQVPVYVINPNKIASSRREWLKDISFQSVFIGMLFWTDRHKICEMAITSSMTLLCTRMWYLCINNSPVYHLNYIHVSLSLLLYLLQLKETFEKDIEWDIYIYINVCVRVCVCVCVGGGGVGVYVHLQRYISNLFTLSMTKLSTLKKTWTWYKGGGFVNFDG